MPTYKLKILQHRLSLLFLLFFYTSNSIISQDKFKIEGQTLHLDFSLPYKKIDTSDQPNLEVSSANLFKIVNVFLYEGSWSARFSCRTYVYVSDEKVMDEKKWMDLYANEIRSNLDSAPQLPQYGAYTTFNTKDTIISGLHLCHAALTTIIPNLATIHNDIIYTRVDNIVYEFKISTSDQDDYASIMSIFASLKIEPAKRKKK